MTLMASSDEEEKDDAWLPCCSAGYLTMPTYYQKGSKGFGSNVKGIFDCTCFQSSPSKRSFRVSRAQTSSFYCFHLIHESALCPVRYCGLIECLSLEARVCLFFLMNRNPYVYF